MSRSGRLLASFAVVLAALAVVYVSGWGRGPSLDLSGPSTPSSAPPPDDRPAPPGLAKATLASGCFWCTESDFDQVKGVIATTSGYIGGSVRRPTYEQVSAGGTGHVEAVEIIFDPKLVGFDELLNHYWRNVDFFNDRGQFCDYGEQYRPVIFVHGAEQRAVAEASKSRVQRQFSGRNVVEILDATAFYPAEDYHQDYYTKNPVRYKYYRWSCGRDARLAQIWRPQT